MSVHGFEVDLPDGTKQALADYAGKALLIVNVASQCGFTSQYAGLEELYRKYKDRGFEILAFPCNQFGGQEPGDAEEIRNFCTLTYDVTFPLFAKIAVNGSDADPLWVHLREQERGLGTNQIKWNFTKFLVDADGAVVHRYAPTTKPWQIEKDIAALLS
ncbi:glutathione peroxidase [Parasphingopyxis marina]|uniref:Glutathione peroxidase n=1 Tax=Parasphingopyxis marina TaxID=2761622 RepID=A0A842I0C4_9SPHN|nr:glutathione peroxidase [Parasphingopyxis marina]MBC2777630.1 glutathione peroxidase [Parasphingopyxis marina]